MAVGVDDGVGSCPRESRELGFGAVLGGGRGEGRGGWEA